MKRFICTALSRHIVMSSLKIALVVGVVLNLVNEGANLWSNETLPWFHVALNFIVPYCVASYSAAKNEVELREGDDG